MHAQHIYITDEMKGVHHPRRWASVLLADRSKLPRKPGVYAVIKQRKIYYIGMSTNLNQRWCGKSHHRFLQAQNLRYPSLHYVLLPRDEARALEKFLIAKYNPPWNYSKVPELRKISRWRRALIMAACLLVLFISSRSLLLGVAAAIVVVALFR
ncbi:MAG: GIY-YIG nuclease family protein [Leptolyngbya sp. SIO3F4]|nr:GIY-YIG nuclease family protein [Leptolyngbya sp. SIO3F4]